MSTFSDWLKSLQESGGYDNDFVEEIPERLTCQICAKPFRDPHLVVCCGKHYCESCLTTSFNKMSAERCPHCRAKGNNFKYVHHQGLKSEISELKVYCLKRDKGCKWVGQLGHLDTHQTSREGCDYEEIPCPNKCKDTVVSNGIVVPLVSNKHVYRKDLSRHLTEECSNRSYYCEYCHIRDTYEVIVEFHYKVCPEHPVPCPNVRCHIRNIKRKQLDNHLRECPEQLVDCPFAEAGCDKKIRRCRLEDHIASQVQKHLSMLMGAYNEVKRRLDELENKPAEPPVAKRSRLSDVIRRFD